MGALLFTPLFVALVALLLKINPLRAIAFSAVSICAMSVCMKIGCYLTGCCGGIVLNGKEVPVQLIEAGLSLLIMVILLVTEWKTRRLDALFSVYMILYAVMRFPIEYLRDTEKNVLGMSVGQITALVVLLLGIAFLCGLIFFQKKQSEEV